MALNVARVWAAAAILALTGCSPVSGDAGPQRMVRGSLSALIGPMEVRGVSADPERNLVYVSLCREAACAIYVAGDGDRLSPVLDHPEWNYRWVSAVGDGALLAVRSRPGADSVENPTSEIILYRPGDPAPSVLRSEAGRITSLQSLEGGAFAYFVSTGMKKVEGCRDDCDYVPVAQRLVVVAADGSVVGSMDDVVDGLAGEAFHPWNERTWVVMPYNTARTRQLTATITAGPSPVLTRYASSAELAASTPADAWPKEGLTRFNMIAEPFRVLGVVAVSEAVDLSGPGHAVLVEPTAGPDPHSINIRSVFRATNDEWRSGRSHTYRF